MSGLLLSDDLIFTSRILATARACGVVMTAAKTPQALLAKASECTPSGVIIDLHHPTLDLHGLPEFLARLKSLGQVSVTAYGSHVDVERLKAARSAGCDRVLPRSAFVERLERELSEWLRHPDSLSPASP